MEEERNRGYLLCNAINEEEAAAMTCMKEECEEERTL